MESARLRISTLAGHLGATSSGFDVAELQHLLEHDNWHTRMKLKELMKDDLFVPYVPMLTIDQSTLPSIFSFFDRDWRCSKAFLEPKEDLIPLQSACFLTLICPAGDMI